MKLKIDASKLLFEILRNEKLEIHERTLAIKTLIRTIIALKPAIEQLGRNIPDFDASTEFDFEVPFNLTDENGHTPLNIATKSGFKDIVNLLIEANANPNMPNPKTGDTSLIVAVSRGFMDIVSLLIEANANPNMPNPKKGETPLMWATYQGHTRIAEFLIVQAKANLELRTHTGITALDEAIATPQINSVHLLLKHNAYIGQPQGLFNLLQKEDQRKPEALVSLNKLSEQLGLYLIATSAEANLELHKLLKEVQNYLLKLEKLSSIHREAVIKVVDEATTNYFPTKLLNIIAQYDAPLENPRIRFFAPKEIDTLLPTISHKKEIDNLLPTISHQEEAKLQAACKCSLM